MGRHDKTPRRSPRIHEVTHEEFELRRLEAGAIRVDRHGNRLPAPDVPLPAPKRGRPRLLLGLAWGVIVLIGCASGAALLLGR